MLQSLNELGYAIEWRVINAADYGMPQKRRRVFFLGYHRSSQLYKKVKIIEKLDWILDQGTIAHSFPIHYTEEFYKFKETTSIIPFLAILDGRQQIKVKEFFRFSQLGILIAIAVIWWSHKYINIAVTTFNSSFLSEFFNSQFNINI